MKALTDTQKMIALLNCATENDITINRIDNNGQCFFVLWYKMDSVLIPPAFKKSLKLIDGLDICSGEEGYMVSKGAWLTVFL